MCSNLYDFKYSNPRRLTIDEIKVLNKMLSVDFIGKEIILNQIETVMVTGYCTCGCKTVTLCANPNTPRYSYPVRVPVEMQ